MNYTLVCLLVSLSSLSTAQDNISFSGSRCLVVDSKNNVLVGIRDKLVKVSKVWWQRS